MTLTTDRNAAAELAGRIKSSRIDPAQADEAGRPPSDRPPAFAEALMSEAPTSVENGAKLSPADWAIIEEVLEHYVACPSR